LESIAEGYAREGAMDKAFKVVDILRGRDEQPGSKFRHILHSHSRKKGTLDTFNKYFPLKSAQDPKLSGELEEEEETTDDMPTQLAWNEIEGMRPAKNQFYKLRSSRVCVCV